MRYFWYVLSVLMIGSYALPVVGATPEATRTFIEAVSKGDLIAVEQQLKGDSTLLYVTDEQYGGTALHWGAAYGRADVVALLIKSGGRVGARNFYAQTPLHLAAGMGFLPLCKSLVEAGASPIVRDVAGKTPREVAEQHGKRDVVLWLGSVKLANAQRLGETRINPRDGAEMVWVPAGEFIQGSNKGDSPDVGNAETPKHVTVLDGYWIYKYEVTIAQYQKFCQETQREMPPIPQGWDNVQYPMTNICWYDAVAYAQWAGGRLPTEAEWEKAARGTDGRLYPWGNAFDPLKELKKCNGGLDPQQAVKVGGSYADDCSPYGAMDMAGNVREWVADWADSKYYLNPASLVNPVGPATGKDRILRGGDHRGNGNIRTACRGAMSPTTRYFTIGFRCAAD